MDSYRVNIPLLTTNRNGLMLIRSFCLFRQSFSNVSDLILHQPNADAPGTKPYNLSPLSVVTKLSLRNVSINLMKDALYNALSWLSRSETPVRMYPKFKLNFSEQ